MILNEFDAYQEALKKINLNEEVMPIYKGRLLMENVDMYCKIQKILACNAFEKAHRWLYDLDIENLNESECGKICNLYKLGIEKGYLEPEDSKIEPEQTAGETPADVTSDTIETLPAPSKPEPAPSMPTSAYTVVYSATRDGQIKTGEAYSNSLNTRSAKADVISKLEKAGYQNISILAIEAGDPDMVGCENTYCKKSDYVLNDCGESDDSLNEEDEEKSDDNSEESSDDEDSEDNSEEESSDDADDESSDDDKKEEAAEEPDEKLKDDAKEEAGKEDATDDKDETELSDQEKTQLKDSYKKAFKAAMQKCKYFDKCFDDLTLEEKIKFFETINEAWGNKADPSKFMSDKETEQLQKIVVKK
jgi:hypothetical protein